MRKIFFWLVLFLPGLSLVAPAADFDGDGTNDLAVFRPASGMWAVRGVTRLYYGRSGDQPLVGDYDADDIVDVGVFRESSGMWAFRNLTRVYYGKSGDRPLFGDAGSPWRNAYGYLEARAYSVTINDLDAIESDLEISLVGFDDLMSDLKVEMGLYGGLGQGYGYAGTTTGHPFHLKSGNVTALTVAADRNVGIGTSHPEQLLEVYGSNPRILVSGYNSNPELNFKTTGSYSNDWAIYKHYSTGDLRFYNDGDKVTLEYGTGRVGIGTTNPAGKLDVNGKIFQRGSQIHADYVFEPGYRLESIEEHARRMWGERHLAAIPKLERDGAGREVVEFGAHQRGIVEELEKAHIYIEQLHERLKVLEEKLARRENG